MKSLMIYCILMYISYCLYPPLMIINTKALFAVVVPSQKYDTSSSLCHFIYVMRGFSLRIMPTITLSSHIAILQCSNAHLFVVTSSGYVNVW